MSSRRGRRGVARRMSRGGFRVERLEPRQLLATFDVTSTADSGAGTLREAITLANLTAESDTIRFNLGGSGVRTIAVTSALPAITAPLVIDGSTQPGFNPSSPTPVVFLNGVSTAGMADGLAFSAGAAGSVVRGLAIGRFGGDGIEVQASNVLIVGNHIGADAAGTAAAMNFGAGVRVVAASGVSIGGATASPFSPGAVGNVISANVGDNVRLEGASGAVVLGNFIGTDRSGTVALRDPDAGGHGVRIVGGSGHVVGGPTPGQGNLISGNGINGVEVDGGSGVLVSGNRIGTTAGGLSLLGNENQGVRLRNGATGNTVGGRNASAFALSAGNLIAGHRDDEVRVADLGTSGNLVVGNFLGVDRTGAAGLPSGDSGIELNNAPGNTVGGADPRLGNVISGNRGDGILISGLGASGNLVQGNRIGTNAAGTAAISNVTEDGIEINGAPDTTVGGAAAGAGNLISGNENNGIRLRNGPTGTLIQGNRIGTNAEGTAAIPNGESGILLEGGASSGASNNTIGGVNASAGVLSAGNLISGNGRHGVRVVGAGSSGNVVLGNFLGTDRLGTLALGNTIHGVLLEGAPGNTIGGANIGLQSFALRAGNLASGNGGDGIRLALLLDGQGQPISASSNNLVSGNYAGTNASGSTAIPNQGAGVAVIGDSAAAGALSGNTIGGANEAVPGATRGNLISGNARLGLLLRGGAVSGNLALGNRIGTNAPGASAVPNGRAPSAGGPIDTDQGIGVLIDGGASANTVGLGNLVSGNLHAGVVIDGSRSNAVSGSRIGTNLAGTGPIGNGIGSPLPNGATDPTELDGNGVFLRDGATGNTIGGTNADPASLSGGNLISGNLADGVAVHGAGSSGNLIAGNRIGTDLAGTSSIGNALDGVEVAGAGSTTIGGVSPGLRNVISGNGSDGVELERGASGASVLGNFVGTDASGSSAIGNGSDGISVFDASDNLIAGNLVSGNGLDGVRIRDLLSTTGIPTTGNRVLGNFIGTDATGAVALGNDDDGVQVVASSGNTIGGVDPSEANLISGNGSYGVVVGDGDGTTSGNLVLGNRVGTTASGDSALGNALDGVLLARGAMLNTIGGVNAGPGARTAGNQISGNGGSGVRMLGAQSRENLLLGNFIGTDADGSSAVGNALDGVRVEGRPSNTIGGTNAGPGVLTAGNLVSGNLGAGIRLIGGGASGNLALGNFVGTNASGSDEVGNAEDGIRVEGAPGNTIGSSNGATASLVAGNLVSGNLRSGIRLSGPGASGTFVLGNFVGTDAPGASGLGNQGPGIVVDRASTNTIGAANGASAALVAGNLVSGNNGDGVIVTGSGASANWILGNFVGTDAGGSSAIGNVGAGVRISASGNSVGVPGVGNLLSGNLGDGLAISAPMTSARANFIGTDATGSGGIGNLGDGVRISSSMMNTIGGNAEGSRNVIADNGGAGVRISGSGASLNIVAGNRIGTDRAGTVALGNSVGVLVTGGSTNNAIGDGNVISGNLGDGVRIEGAGGGGTENAVAGNFIGLGPDGSTPVGNAGDGVRVVDAARNTIASNIASANGGFGIALVGRGTTGSVVQSNRVGTGDAGLLRRGNAGGGILVGNSPGNLVGGPVAAEGNIVSANLGPGVEIRGEGASGNLVAGNVVGLAATGDAPLGNSGDGIALLDGASGNTIGGQVAAAGNVVSGNSRDGLVLAGGATRNVVSGNLIGTNAAGDLAIGNASTGVRISDAPDNTLGGRANLISGNGAFGVAIAGLGASGNVVSGNLIGTDLAGSSPLGTQRVGLVILNAPGNRVVEGNLIAGHLEDGVQLLGPPASGNLVEGNLIGTDEAGRDGLGNARGVFLDGSPGNTIRANTVAGNLGDGLVLINGSSGNLLSGNLVGLAGEGGAVVRGNLSGVLVVNADGNTLDANVLGGNRGFGAALAGTSGNLLSGNLIGVDPGGTRARPNASDGVMVFAASGNTLSGNVVSANRLFGVELRNGSSGNLLAENLIGTDRSGSSPLGNASDGVHLDGASGNTLSGNVISANLLDGVKLISSSANNTLSGNLIGTDRSGTARLGNQGSGILAAGAPNNRMQGNVTSGNRGFGIGIVGASGNLVVDGLVGTDATGAVGLGNGLSGILLFNASRNSVLNSVVSANGASDIRGNVRIDGPGATGNQVLGSRIGTDRAGSRSLDPNLGGVRQRDPEFPADGTPSPGNRTTFDPRNDGVVIAGGASANSVGGTGGGQGNQISGNRIGVYVRDQSGGNVLVGNRIGTNPEGTSAIPNGDGVIVLNSSGNTIGGLGSASRNVISGNLEAGVRLTSLAFDGPRAPAAGNVVAGNYIGTNAAGDAAVPNRQGVFVYGASNNRIGLGSFADAEGGGNLLSGNFEVGVQILNADTINAQTESTPAGPAIVPSPSAVGAVTSGNVVAGNRIGSDASGTARVPNYQGVFLSDAPGNAVVDNLIGGNVQVGLNLTAFNAVGNFVGGNRIGPDISGNLGPLANGFGDPNGLGTGLLLNQVRDGANTIAPTNDLRGNTTAQTRTRSIASGPFVEGVIPIVDPATGVLTRVDVRINGYLSRDASVTLNPANYAIEPIGGAGPIGLASISYDEVARLVSITPASPLPAGSAFRLTLVGQAPGGLRSRTGPGAPPAFLDGNLDSRAGGNFVQVVNVPARTASAAMTARAIDALLDLDDLS